VAANRERIEQAKKDYLAGMTYKDIAAKYDVSTGTVRAWKSRHNWDDKLATQHIKNVATKTQRVADEMVDDLANNEDLTEKQKLFCILYLQSFNATKAYRKAYNCSWKTANTNGPRMLVNAGVQNEIERLKKARQKAEAITAEDIIHELKKQAFVDIGDYVTVKRVKHKRWTKHFIKGGPFISEYGKHYEWLPFIDPDTGEQGVYYENVVEFTGEGDTSLLKSIRIDEGDAVVETYDKQRALLELLKRYPNSNAIVEQQLRKLKAEADIAEGRAAEYSDNDGAGEVVIVDDIPGYEEAENQD
jgi:phage terminase small subunit